MSSIHPIDTDFHLPDFTLVSASAGSGKTHTLTLRYLQFILSDRIPNSLLRNILAITFTNNAAREMKQRILEYLKKATLGDNMVVQQLTEVISIDEDQLKTRARRTVDELLNNYSEFQVQTIDSFISRVFRASALELGFSPATEILLNSSSILQKAFERFTHELASDPSRRNVLDRLIEILLENQQSDSRFLWDPFAKLSDEVRRLYNALGNRKKEVLPEPELLKKKKELQAAILATFDELHKLVRESGFEIQKNFEAVIESAKRRDVDDLIGRKSLYNAPFKKSAVQKSGLLKLDLCIKQCGSIQETLQALAHHYSVAVARTYYHAYAEAHRFFQQSIEQVMKQEGQITIADVNKQLARFLETEIVPEIYFYLGDRIHHYLIDEFQDTSRLQWDVLQPLADESLSKGGSLFIVGDTKQSIYTFRGADWQIMRKLVDGENGFLSAPVTTKTLDTNFRSFGTIIDFNKEVFHTVIPSLITNGAQRLSGLSDFEQHVNPEFKGKGLVEVSFIEEDDGRQQQKAAMLRVLVDCHARGYSYNEITILTPKNEDVVEISSWLNEQTIPFISHSSLDIRGRKITGELIAFLRFLDSPVDTLAFMTFVLGDVFELLLKRKGSKLDRNEFQTFLFDHRRSKGKSTATYAAFRQKYPKIWEEFFEDLFNRVGYLPLYDLVSELYKSLDIFTLVSEEEGSLVKFLEVIKDFEENGQNSLKDFLAFAEDESDDSDWDIPIPQGSDAVSVMTIHKAKGLGNRVVIVLLVDSHPRRDNLFVEEDDGGLHLIRITKEITGADTTLAKLYSERQIRDTVDDLNKLYVALTRAEEEMYVISVKSEKVRRPSEFLPATGHKPHAKPVVTKSAEIAERAITLEHPTTRAALQPVSSEKLGLYERKRGDYIHAILSRIEYIGPNVGEQIRKLAGDIRLETKEQFDSAAIEETLVSFLKLPETAGMFSSKEHRRILNEQEFAQRDGRLYRMDRIIVDSDTVTVVDYKTGDEKEGYVEQVRGYMKLLRDVYPDLPVRGLLAYVDRHHVQEVTSSVE